MTGTTGQARLLTLSAPTPAALERATDELAHRLAELDDTGFARLARPPAPHARRGSLRRAVVADTAAEAARRLRDRDPRRVFTGGPGSRPTQVLLFSGVGDQYPRLGAGLSRCLPEFRRVLDRCLGLLLAEHDLDLRPVLFPPAPSRDPAPPPGPSTPPGQGEPTAGIHRTRVAQPLMFSLQYALARALEALGARPCAVAGYSVGEYAAACVAGVWSLEEALGLVARRARLVEELPPGAMLAVAAAPAAVSSYVHGRVTVAALNGPEQTVVSGPVPAVEDMARRLTADGVACLRSATAHAYHSPLTRPLTRPLEKLLRARSPRPPRIPVLSNTTGTWLSAAEATSPAYWARQLSRPIRFADGLSELWRLPHPLLVEAGPGQALSRLALQHPARPHDAASRLVQTLPGRLETRTERTVLLAAAGRLWAAGAPVDWTPLEEAE